MPRPRPIGGVHTLLWRRPDLAGLACAGAVLQEHWRSA